MLAQCPCFVGTGGEYADEGTLRHRLLANKLKQVERTHDDETQLAALLKELSDEDIEGVEWAENYIRVNAPMADYPLATEYHVNPVGSDFQPLFENGGTLDFACGPEIFDFKWRPRNYREQLAAYALGWMQETGRDFVSVRALFGATKTVSEYNFDLDSALAAFEHLLAPGEKKPKPCDYCSWCSKAFTCPALLGQAQAVAAGYSEEPAVKQWHPSKMVTGEEFAAALHIWRAILEPWGDSLEFHALEAAQKYGRTLPGFELKTRSGKQWVADATASFAALGLPQADFLACCEPRLNTSKKYPDKKGIVNTYAAFHGMKKAPAGREVLRKLGDLIKRGRDSVFLRAIKSTAEDEEGDE